MEHKEVITLHGQYQDDLWPEDTRSNYGQTYDIRHNIPKPECFSPRFAVLSAQSFEAKCLVENEDF